MVRILDIVLEFALIDEFKFTGPINNFYIDDLEYIRLERERQDFQTSYDLKKTIDVIKKEILS